MTMPISFDDGLRGLLADLSARGHTVVTHRSDLSPKFEIAAHYGDNFATSPASARTGDEPCVLYESNRSPMPVLLGLYGARRRNAALLFGCPRGTASRLAAQITTRIPPVLVARGSCHQTACGDGLAALPVLTTTPSDAGPYLTSGLVCATDPDTGQPNVSIHRMRVLDAQRLTIWMLPGRDLDHLYRKATAAGRPLEISINIGVSPAVYLTSSLSSPFIDRGTSELALAGAVQGKAVELARCKTNAALCIASSEVVIEGEITAAAADEFSDPVQRWAMPEFLGYMGHGRPGLPVIAVTGVWHRENAVYQTFLGPGKEQSELLAVPTEAGMLWQVNRCHAQELQVLDAHYLAPGGGQLVLALQVRKYEERPDTMRRLLDTVVANHKLAKAVWVVDEDVDIHSPEDLIWACATRFQPTRDLCVRSGQPGFPLDPSQALGYLDSQEPITDKYLLDLTAPMAQRTRFARWNSPRMPA
jgi:gallate decarboxylase subunit C